MSSTPTLSLIVPTLNEQDNIHPLLEDLHRTLANFSHEIIVVDDDSSDQTAEVVRRYAESHPQVKLVSRTKKEGLSAAILDGFHHATGLLLGVIDADLSHDTRILPDLISKVLSGTDIAVGSRRVPGGGADHWPIHRRLYSSFATALARLWLRCSLNDPMSGYFVMNRKLLETLVDPLNPKGYKILLEIVTRSQTRNIVEVPFIFKDRKQGISKLNTRVAWNYLVMLLDLKHYSAPMHLLRKFYHTGRYKKIRRFLEPGRLLDIGCGRPCETMPEQAFLRFLDRIDSTGLDIKSIQGPYPFVQGSMTNMPFENEKFHNVVAMEVIEHLEDTEKAISEVHRVLDQGGVFIMTTPDCHPVWEWLWDRWTQLIGQMWHEAHLISVRSKEWFPILEKKFKVVAHRRHWFFDLIYVCRKEK